MTFILILLLCFVAFCVIMWNYTSSLDKKDELNKNKIKAVLDKNPYKISKIHMDSEGKNAVAVDERNNLIIVKNIKDNIITNTISPFDIIESEIIEDGYSVIKASRGSQLGGAIVGGVLAGGVGAIIGGVTGKKTKSDRVKVVKLRLTLNDIDNPIYEYYFLNKEVSIEKSKPMYKLVYDKAIHWQKTIEVIIKNSLIAKEQ